VKGQRGLLTKVSGPQYEKNMVYYPDGSLKTAEWTIPGWLTLEKKHQYYPNKSVRSVETTIKRIKDASIIEKTTEEFLQDQTGRASGLRLNGKILYSLFYDDEGDLEEARFENGDILKFKYDEVTKGIKGYWHKTRQWESDFSFDLDQRGHVDKEAWKIEQKSLSRTYGYDERGFLTSSTDQETKAKYNYDDNGLPSSIEDPTGARKLVRSQNPMKVGNATYSFDSIGRLVAKDDLKLSYGPDGHLRKAERLGRSWSFSYDEKGQRFLKEHEGKAVAAYIEEHFITETVRVSPLVIGGHLVGALVNGEFRPLITDARGTMVGEAASAVSLASPFGLRSSHPALAAALDYVQKGYDADLGLIRMGVRDYDPLISQFITPDPLFLEQLNRCAQSPTECNLYSYALNNPLLFVDPTGQSVLGIIFSVIEIAVGVVTLVGTGWTGAGAWMGYLSIADGVDNLVANIRSEFSDSPVMTGKQALGYGITKALGGDEETAQGMGLVCQLAPAIVMGGAGAKNLGTDLGKMLGGGAMRLSAESAALGYVGNDMIQIVSGTAVSTTTANAIITGTLATTEAVTAASASNIMASRGVGNVGGGNKETIGEAKRQFAKNIDFRRWFHKEYKPDTKGASNQYGRHNPDLSDDQLLDAWREWNELGRPKVK
jgi:RHS repeat-associated protein